jgi:hypothetical protein
MQIETLVATVASFEKKITGKDDIIGDSFLILLLWFIYS